MSPRHATFGARRALAGMVVLSTLWALGCSPSGGANPYVAYAPPFDGASLVEGPILVALDEHAVA